MKYDVTIGIPVYKSADYIRRSLESALNQTYSSIEFLMIDDGGADGSMDIIEQLKAEHQRGGDIRIIRGWRIGDLLFPSRDGNRNYCHGFWNCH